MTDVLLGQSYYLRFDPKLATRRSPIRRSARCSRPRAPATPATRSPSSTPCWRRLRASGRRRSTGERPRFAVLYEDSFNYLTKMCLRRMREAAFAMIAAARRAACTALVAGSDATDHAEALPGRGRRRGGARRGRGHAGRGCSTRSAGRGDGGLRGRRRARAAGAPTAASSRTPPRPFLKDLDALPFPAWDLVDVRPLPRGLARAARLLLDEPGDHARLPVPLQLVREADLRPALRRAQPRERGRRDGLARSARTRPTTSGSSTTSSACSPGWVERVRRRRRGAPARALPFKCLLAGRPAATTTAVARAARAPAAARSGSAPSRARSRSSTRWRRARASSRSARPRARLHAAGHRGRLLPAVRLPGRDARGHRARRCALVRECAPDDIGISVSYPLPGTPFYERVRGRARRQAELGRLRRPGDAVPRAVPDRVLPRAAPRRAPGVPPAAPARTPRAALRHAAAAPATTRPRCPSRRRALAPPRPPARTRAPAPLPPSLTRGAAPPCRATQG